MYSAPGLTPPPVIHIAGESLNALQRLMARREQLISTDTSDRYWHLRDCEREICELLAAEVLKL